MAGSDKFLEAWRAMIEMKQDGRARSIGVSNFTEANLSRLIKDSGVTPAVNQIELHPGFAQRELRAFHERHGIATESWSPLAQGKAVQEKVIQELARKHGKTPAQITLRWHLQSDLIVIPKSVTPARIRENIDVFDFELSRADMDAIDGIVEGARLGPDPGASANERCAPGLGRARLRGQERASAFSREGPVAHDHAQQDGQRRPGSPVPAAGAQQRGQQAEHAQQPQHDGRAPDEHETAILLAHAGVLCTAAAASCRRIRSAMCASVARRRASHRYRPLTSTTMVIRSSRAQMIFSGMPP